MFSHELTEIRLNKASQIRDNGSHPYVNASNVSRTVTNADFLDKYENVGTDKEYSFQFTEVVVGRVKLLRLMGKSGFMTIQDQSGDLQAFVSLSNIGEAEYEVFKKLLDIGDIISVKGHPFYTKTGELSIHALEFNILTKALLPLPDKHNGLEDKEIRYRKRYLDMIANKSSTDVFVARAKIIAEIRNLMQNSFNFLEVETPMLNAIPGGANARPFQTFHNALGVERYLRIAPELYLKRMIVGGLERVFEIGKNFRNEGIDATHNPEFTSIEFYAAYNTYEDLMIMIESMFSSIMSIINLSKNVIYGDLEINFNDWSKIPFRQALIEIGEVPDSILDSKEEIISFLKNKDITVKAGLSLGKLWEELFDLFVEKQLINPTFITEYPTEISPLARRHDSNPDIAERFELFIAGREIANGFNELNDPVDQYERFKAQVDSKGSDDEAMHMDTDFVEALMHGMPPTAGAGIGIDRLVMLLTNQHSIRDVIPFPAMK